MSKTKSKRTPQAPTQGETLKNMKTPLEQQLEDVEMIESNQKRSKKITETYAQAQQEELEEVGRVTVNDLKQADQERLSILVNHLIAKNKINAKNAFEVPLIQLGETNDFNTMNGDNSWKKVSSNLENNNKIYGYRVDAAHNFTYKMLELVTRSERKDAVGDEEISKSYRYNNISLNTQFFSDCLEDYYVKHLERNQKNINILHVDTFFNANPILQKTKRTFDQQGLKALLLNNVGIGEDLALLIYFESGKSIKMKMQNLDWEEEKEQQQLQTGDCLKDYNIFSKIYGICCLHDLLDEDVVEVKREESQFQSIWREFEHMAQSNTNKIVEINLEHNEQPEPQQPTPSEELKVNQTEIAQKINEEVCSIGNLTVEQNKQHKHSAQDLLHGNLEDNEKQMVEAQKNQQASSEKQKEAQKISENHPDPKEASQQPELHVEACENQLIKAQQGAQENTPLFLTVLDNHDQVERDNHIDQTSQEPSKTIFESVLLSQSKYTPISSIITFRYFKKDNISSDPILRELQVGTQLQKEKQSALEKWKNIDNPSKKQRKPRVKKEKDPQFDHINFKQPLDMRKAQNKRSSILAVDKVKKLEIKKFLKNVAESYKVDTYTYFDTSKWRYSFDITTVIRQSIAFENQTQEQSQHCGSPEIIDLQVLNLTTTSALMRAASIRSVKQRIRIFMFDDHLSSFIKIYNQYVADEGTISPALCFLTVLHLCNEQNLKLVQKEENDFEITEQE